MRRPRAPHLFALLRRTSLFAAFALGAALPASPAHAEDPATKKAQPLFDEATAEMDKGDYASACPKLEEVTRLVPDGVGAKETLGECYERQGRLASAHRQYTFAAEAATRQNKLDRAKAASAHAAVLRAKLSTLVLVIADPPSGMVVRLDGVALGGEPWKAPVPVDPGKYKLEVEAPGRKAFSTTVEIRGERAAVKVPVPALEEIVPTGAPEAPAPGSRPADGAPDSPPGPSRVNARFIGGLAASGVGVVSVGLGIASSLQVSGAQAQIDDLRRKILPGTDVCDASGQAALTAGEQQRARDACGQAAVFEPLQLVLYGLGAVSAGAGVYLLVTSRAKAPAPSVTMVAPAIGRGGGGLVLSGSW